MGPGPRSPALPNTPRVTLATCFLSSQFPLNKQDGPTCLTRDQSGQWPWGGWGSAPCRGWGDRRKPGDQSAGEHCLSRVYRTHGKQRASREQCACVCSCARVCACACARVRVLVVCLQRPECLGVPVCWWAKRSQGHTLAAKLWGSSQVCPVQEPSPPWPPFPALYMEQCPLASRRLRGLSE